MIFKENSNPINVCNRVLKRLCNEGSILSIPRTKDQTYLYTNNPSQIHHKSRQIDHHLKIVDFFIALGCPKDFIIEPSFGEYEPDIFMRDKQGKTVCVEIQITRISSSKMQEKINKFVRMNGKEHDSKTFVIVSDYKYKVSVPQGYQIKCYGMPKELVIS